MYHLLTFFLFCISNIFFFSQSTICQCCGCLLWAETLHVACWARVAVAAEMLVTIEIEGGSLQPGVTLDPPSLWRSKFRLAMDSSLLKPDSVILCVIQWRK